MIARELLIKLGFNIDENKLNKFNSSIEKTKEKMKSVKSVTNNAFKGGLGGSLSSKLFTGNQSDKELRSYHNEFEKLTKKQQKDILALNALEQGVAVKTTAVKKAEIKKQSAFASLNNVARKLSIASTAAVAGIGFSIRSTLKDAANFKVGKSSNFFDKKQIQAVDSFNKESGKTKKILSGIRNSFVIGLLPALKKTLQVFNAWIEKNKVLIQEKLKNLVDGLSLAFNILRSVLVRVFNVLDFLISKTIGWKAAISAIVVIGVSAWFISLASSIISAAKAFKVLSLAILSNPLVLVISGIVAAFVLLADEIYTTIQGGDSFINDFLKSDAWESFGSGIKNIIRSWGHWWDIIKQVKNSLLEVLKVTADFVFDLPITPSVILKKYKSYFDKDKSTGRKLGNGNIKQIDIPSYSASDMNKNITNNMKNNSISQKNDFTFNVTTTAGTTEQQARDISAIVTKQIEKTLLYESEKNLTAISSY